MTSVTLKLDSDTAMLFSKAPAEDKSKLASLWCLLIREYRDSELPLDKVMDAIGARAKKRGLTANKLESILNVD